MYLIRFPNNFLLLFKIYCQRLTVKLFFGLRNPIASIFCAKMLTLLNSALVTQSEGEVLALSR